MNAAPHEVALESRVEGARPTYRFRTADGVHSKGSLRTAELRLVERLWDDAPRRLLVPEANYGVVPTVLADRADAVRATEASARARDLCERNARRNGAAVETDLVADIATLDGPFDAAAYAPKPYTPLAVGKQRVADALSVLEPGGRVYLAAADSAGVARYEDCLHGLAGGLDHHGERDGVGLLEATRPDAVDPPTYVEPRTVRPTVDGTELALVTVPGLFSAGGLDDGTRLLLEAADVADGDRVLDLCCGYGAAGVYAARTADCEVWLTDDDRVATRCAECSLRASGVEGTVVTADCLDGVAGRTFDAVLCNPPTHAGDGVLSELLGGVPEVLAPGGELLVVHHRSLDLRTHLSEFGSVERRSTGSEHVVLGARV